MSPVTRDACHLLAKKRHALPLPAEGHAQGPRSPGAWANQRLASCPWANRSLATRKRCARRSFARRRCVRHFLAQRRCARHCLAPSLAVELGAGFDACLRFAVSVLRWLWWSKRCQGSEIAVFPSALCGLRPDLISAEFSNTPRLTHVYSQDGEVPHAFRT